MSYAAYHPGETVASANDVFSSLSIPIDSLGAHLWIVAGVAPSIIHRVAELMSTELPVFSCAHFQSLKWHCLYGGK